MSILKGKSIDSKVRQGEVDKAVEKDSVATRLLSAPRAEVLQEACTNLLALFNTKAQQRNDHRYLGDKRLREKENILSGDDKTTMETKKGNCLSLT